MTITVRRHERPVDAYEPIRRDFMRDATLSLEARGLGGYLLTHTELFELTEAKLAKLNGCGVDKIKSALAALEERGYLRRERMRGVGGKLGSMRYDICDEPIFLPAEDDQCGENQHRSNQHRSDQGRTNQGRTIPTHKETSSPKENNESQEDQLPPGGEPAATPGDGGLFEAPQEPETAPTVAPAQSVTAAYVDAFRERTGHDPLRQDIGKVAGTAKRLTQDPSVDQARLLAAATSLGRGIYTDLAAEYRRMMAGVVGGAGTVVPNVRDPRSVAYSGNDRWEREAQQRREATEPDDGVPAPTYF